MNKCKRNNISVEIRIVSINFLLILFSVHFCAGQPAVKIKSMETDSIIRYAENLVFHEQQRAGDEILSQIKIEDAESLNEQFFNGRILLAKYDLLNARDLLDNALNKDKTNIELHYYLGITCRELARNKTYLTYKDKMYDKSRENFGWIIKHDSTYKDVFFQYGLLLDYDGKNVEAVENMLKQLRLKPALIEPYTGLRNIFQRKIREPRKKDIEDIFKYYSNLKEIDYKNYLYGEFLRINNRLDEAREIFTSLLKKESKMPKSLVYNSLLKVYAKSDKKQEVVNCFWEAVRELKSNLDADILFYDLKYISNPEEIEVYQSLSYPEKKNQFFKAFWERHNPMTTMKDNPRIFEHYKRLATAEDSYQDTRERFYYTRCKLDEFTDQGLIYIRYGAPDNKISTSNSSAKKMTGLMHESANDPNLLFYEKDPRLIASNVFSNNIETWYYTASQDYPDMEFHFWGKNRKFLTYIVDLKALLERSESGFDPLYGKILRAMKIPLDTLLEFNKDPFANDIPLPTDKIFNASPYLIEKTTKNANTIVIGLAKERSTIKKDIKIFDLANSAYTFRGKGAGTILELAYLIDKSLLYEKIPDSVKELKSEFNIGIYDKNWNRIFLKTDTIVIKRMVKGSENEFRFNRFNLEIDSCQIAFTLHPLETEIYRKSKIDLKIPDYLTPGLKISDIETGIQQSSGPGIFNKNGKILFPKATSDHDLKTPLSVYYEIYDLKKNEDSKTMYKIEYSVKYAGPEDVLKKLLSSGNRENSISVEYFQIGKEKTEKQFISFDLNKLVPGKYSLEVKITDMNASKTVMKKKELVLYE